MRIHEKLMSYVELDHTFYEKKYGIWNTISITRFHTDKHNKSVRFVKKRATHELPYYSEEILRDPIFVVSMDDPLTTKIKPAK